MDRPENIAKFDDIEQRLVEKGLLLPLDCGGGKGGPSKFPRGGSGSNASSKIGSDGRSLGRSSDSGGSELNPSGPPEKLVTLYDSLAAELREKLNGGGGKHAPLLLPPRDYDTMHRGRGNLTGIDKRRALNPAIVGGGKKSAGGGSENNNKNAAVPPDMLSSEEEEEEEEEEQSSSGIGSDNDAHHRNEQNGGRGGRNKAAGNGNGNSPANLLAASGEGNGPRYSSGRMITLIPNYCMYHLQKNTTSLPTKQTSCRLLSAEEKKR